MTVIIGYEVSGSPVLHSDTLLTRRIFDRSEILTKYYPSFSSGTQQSKNFPFRLSQKIEIVSDNIAFAWAGSAKNAIDFKSSINNIIDRSPSYPIDEIQNLFHTYTPDNDRDDFAAIMYIVQHGKVFLILHCAQMLQMGEWGSIFMSGSGNPAYYGLLSHMESESPKEMPSGFSKEVLSSTWFLRPAHTDAILSHYSMNGFGLEHAAGAFMETASHNGEKFVKRDNFYYIYWNMYRKNGNIVGPQVLLSKRYRNGNLIVSCQNAVYGEFIDYIIPSIDKIDEFYINNPSCGFYPKVSDASYALLSVEISEQGRLSTFVIGGAKLREMIQISSDRSKFSFDAGQFIALVAERFGEEVMRAI